MAADRGPLAEEDGFRWSMLGFRSRPYDPRPLAGDADARELLVGRDGQRAMIRDHLTASSAHLTIDGPNGNGKTSLIRCILGELATRAQSYEQGELLVPIEEPLNLEGEESPAKFRDRALIALANALVANKALIRRAGNSAGDHLGELDRLINSPVFGGGSLGVAFAGFGGSGSHSSTPNPSFHEFGLPLRVQQSLQEAFPADEAGGLVVCVDNAESLKNRVLAREFLDSVRDPLLRLPGVRWIFLGANGILDSLSNHPRLDGVLSSPLQLSDLSPAEAAEAVERRLCLFRIGPQVTVPVGGEGFRHVYESCGRHLRTALSLCENFGVQAATRGLLASNQLIEQPYESDGERWIRWELPVRFIKAYVNDRCLKEWDRVVKMGATATELLRELEGIEAVSKLDLDAEEQPRKGALRRLQKGNLVIAVRNQEDRRRVDLRLSASGALAATGGRFSP